VCVCLFCVCAEVEHHAVCQCFDVCRVFFFSPEYQVCTLTEFCLDLELRCLWHYDVSIASGLAKNI